MARKSRKPHSVTNEPSPWVVRFSPMIPGLGRVLDLACGSGRHCRFLLEKKLAVTALDRDVSGVADLRDRLEIIEADLEDGKPYPLKGRVFEGIVVTNYLHRPILPEIVAGVGPGGLLIYETFTIGNERFGKPSNPNFLLRPGELLDVVRGQLSVLAYEDLIVDWPRPAAIQRIAALRPQPSAD